MHGLGVQGEGERVSRGQTGSGTVADQQAGWTINCMSLNDLSRALDCFGTAATIGELEDGATALLKGKLVNKAREDQRFRAGLQTCFKITAPDTDRLKAVSIAYRLGATSKPVMRMVRPLAVLALVRELPPLDLLTNGEDRYYAALSVNDVDAPWVPQFAARGITLEENAETARYTLARRLFSDRSVADAMTLLADNLATLTFKTEKPTESAAKRLRRVVAAIRHAIVEKPIPPGDDLGKALKKLFESPFANVEPALESELSEELSSECCALVHDILRTQLSVVADPEIYRSLQVARYWITPLLWPGFLRSDVRVANVRAALEDAILLLAKQGVTDQALLDALAFFFATREEAASRTKQIAENNTGLDARVREWLVRFGRARSTPVLSSMTDAREANSDPAIASLLVLAESLKNVPENTDAVTGAVPTLETVRPPQIMNRLISEIGQLAGARGLSLRLKPGEIVEYSQHAHELVGSAQMGMRHVRVVRPLVERRGADGIVAVIQKALVEALGDTAP